MHLKLDSIPKQKLEIEKPDGEIITLTVKQVTLQQAAQNQKVLQALEKKFNEGSLLIDEYLSQSYSMLVEEFDKKFFLTLQIPHLLAIAEALQELQKSKASTEKKSQSEKSLAS